MGLHRDPVGQVPAEIRRVRGHPLRRVLVPLRAVCGRSDRDECTGVRHVVCELLAPRRRPGVGTRVPRLFQGDEMVDVEPGGIGGGNTVVPGGPVPLDHLAPGPHHLRRGRGLRDQDFFPRVASIAVGIDPVPEFCSLVAVRILPRHADRCEERQCRVGRGTFGRCSRGRSGTHRCLRTGQRHG